MSNVSTQLTKVMDVSSYLCRLLDPSYASSPGNMQQTSQTDTLVQNSQPHNKRKLICDRCHLDSNCQCGEHSNKRMKTVGSTQDVETNSTSQASTNSLNNIMGKLNQNPCDKLQVISNEPVTYESEKSILQSSRDRLSVAIESSVVRPNNPPNLTSTPKNDINRTRVLNKKSPNFISSKIDVSDINILRKQNVSIDKPAKAVRPNVSKSSISTQTIQNRPIILNHHSKPNSMNQMYNNTSLNNSSVFNATQQHVLPPNFHTVSSDNSNPGQFLTLHTINLPFNPIPLPQIGQQPVTQIAQQQISLPQLGQNLPIPQVGQQQMFFQLQPSQTGLQITSVPQTNNATHAQLITSKQHASDPVLSNNTNQPTSTDNGSLISSLQTASSGSNQAIVSVGLDTTISQCVGVSNNDMKSTIIPPDDNNVSQIMNHDSTNAKIHMQIKQPTSSKTNCEIKKISDVCLSQSSYTDEESDSIKDLITIDDDVSESSQVVNTNSDNFFVSDESTFSPANTEGHGNIFEKMRPSLVRRHMRLQDTAFDVRKHLTFDSEFSDLYPDSENTSETKPCDSSSITDNMANSANQINSHQLNNSQFFCTACKYISSSSNYVFKSEPELQQHTLTCH